MDEGSRLEKLLASWWEQRLQGRDTPPAELCHDQPELLTELERRIAHLQQIGPMFQGASAHRSLAGQSPQSHSSSELMRTLKTIVETAADFRARAAPPGYELLGELGRGGMGVVYKARQLRLDRVVALKMILSGGHASSSELARFKNEARAIARLQHPSIVQIYDVGEQGGLPYFALEYCAGGSLDKKLAGTPLPPREAAALIETLARAMHAAHEKGVVHRDLKPANVLLAADGTGKVTDFGLAKKLGEAGRTHTGAVMGTPSYMAPEQARGEGKHIGPACDIYALGAILYECLTGRPPFKAATSVDTLRQTVHEEPVSPRQLQSQTPRDLETITLKCLQKEAGKRYASAADLAEDLHRFQIGAPVAARPVRRAERLWRWCRRNPRVAGLSAALVLMLASWAATSSTLYSIAARNERKAQENEQKAIGEAARANDKAKEAERNAAVARSRQHHAFQGMVALGDELQKRLRSRRLSEQLGPQARQMRQQLMDVLRKKMLEMARDSEAKGVYSFGTVAIHQQLGDLLLRFGQGKEALQQYEEGRKIIAKEVREQPHSDRARANLAVMLKRVGDIALEVNGDAQAARSYYQKAWDLQYEIYTQPQGDFAADQSVIALSHFALQLGQAMLQMGHPAEATKQFDEALKRRQEWHEIRSRQPMRTGESRSWLAQAHVWLGTADWHRGDAKACDEHFRQCLNIYDDLLKEYPRFIPYQSDLAEIHQAQGDAQLHLGRLDEAARSYQRARANLDIYLSHDPDNPSPLPLSALLHERLGADAQRRGQREQAQKHYQEALKIRHDLAQLEPENRVWQAAYLLVLARCGRCDEAARRAEQLRRQAAGSPELLLQLARCHALCAAAAGQKQSHIAKAVETLQALAALDYRDPVLLRTDPDLASLRTEPVFLALLEKKE